MKIKDFQIPNFQLENKKIGNKEKGANAERELYKMFIDNNWRAVRVAGSGVMENTSCDLIAGKPRKKYCIEVKASKKTSKYITKKQVEEFLIFSQMFGLKPILALRFNREGWFFINPKELEDTGKYWKINLEKARKKGKRFGQAFDEQARKEMTNEKIYDELMKD